MKYYLFIIVILLKTDIAYPQISQKKDISVFNYKIDNLKYNQLTCNLKCIDEYKGLDIRKSRILSIAIDSFCNILKREDIDTIIKFSFICKRKKNKFINNDIVILECWSFKSSFISKLSYDNIAKKRPDKECAMFVNSYYYILYDNCIICISGKPQNQDILLYLYNYFRT